MLQSRNSRASTLIFFVRFAVEIGIVADKDIVSRVFAPSFKEEVVRKFFKVQLHGNSDNVPTRNSTKIHLKAHAIESAVKTIVSDSSS